MNTGLKPILYVDDDANDVLLLEHAFKRAGVHGHLTAVSDGQEAEDYLSGKGAFGDRTRYPRPCLVLLDLKMPRVSGLDFLKWLRAQPEYSSVIVIVFSSSDSESDIRAAYRAGANSFIAKPVNPIELGQIMRLLEGWWLDLNRFAPHPES